TYRVDHVVLYSDAVSIDDATDIFRSAVLVVASSEPLAGRAVSDVRLDASAATREVVDHLVEKGSRHFVYLSGRSSSHIDKQRMGWFSAALKTHELAFDIVEHGDYSYESGYKEAVLLLRRGRPDVIVCANDLMAIGVKDAANLLNIRVPEDLAIVGHDGVALASWDAHSITTIMPPEGHVSDALAEIIDSATSSLPMRRTIACMVRWGRSTPAK
ncbi:MAG: LacI family transcriptional regulator, partial [Hyphomicrobiales bacterium]